MAFDARYDTVLAMIKHVIDEEGPVLDIFVARRTPGRKGGLTYWRTHRDRVVSVADRVHRKVEEDAGHREGPAAYQPRSRIADRQTPTTLGQSMRSAAWSLCLGTHWQTKASSAKAALRHGTRAWTEQSLGINPNQDPRSDRPAVLLSSCRSLRHSVSCARRPYD